MADPRRSASPRRSVRVRPSRAIARRARRLVGYWRAERRTLRQGLVALTLSTLAGFAAGLPLAALTGTLESLPGLIVLIPAAVGMRGVISGATAARLGTSIAAGLFEVSWRPGGILRRNVMLGVVLTLGSSLFVAALARVGAAAFGQRSISFLDLATISIVGGTLGSALVLAITVVLAVTSFRRGYDLDAVATPVVTAVGDMVTVPSLLLATLLVRTSWAHAVIGPAVIALAVAGTVIGFRREPTIRRMLLEMAAVLVLVPVLDVLAGITLESRSAELFRYPGLLLLIPPFISQAGALGGIFSSRLTSKLRIGVITPRGRPEPPAIVDGSIVVGYAVAIFALIGVVAVALGDLTGRALPGTATTVGGTVLAGVFVLPLLLLLGYYLAVGTTRFGLDPDNQSVPLITGVMDLTGVIAVVLAMSLLGVQT
jgi:mgtE-like transporter